MTYAAAMAAQRVERILAFEPEVTHFPSLRVIPEAQARQTPGAVSEQVPHDASVHLTVQASALVLAVVLPHMDIGSTPLPIPPVHQAQVPLPFHLQPAWQLTQPPMSVVAHLQQPAEARQVRAQIDSGSSTTVAGMVICLALPLPAGQNMQLPVVSPLAVVTPVILRPSLQTKHMLASAVTH